MLILFLKRDLFLIYNFMKLTKKILQQEKLIAELCRKRNWNPDKLSPYQISILVKEVYQLKLR
jgi:hypothetical protein